MSDDFVVASLSKHEDVTVSEHVKKRKKKKKKGRNEKESLEMSGIDDETMSPVELHSTELVDEPVKLIKKKKKKKRKHGEEDSGGFEPSGTAGETEQMVKSISVKKKKEQRKSIDESAVYDSEMLSQESSQTETIGMEGKGKEKKRKKKKHKLGRKSECDSVLEETRGVMESPESGGNVNKSRFKHQKVKEEMREKNNEIINDSTADSDTGTHLAVSDRSPSKKHKRKHRLNVESTQMKTEGDEPAEDIVSQHDAGASDHKHGKKRRRKYSGDREPLAHLKRKKKRHDVSKQVTITTANLPQASQKTRASDHEPDDESPVNSQHWRQKVNLPATMDEAVKMAIGEDFRPSVDSKYWRGVTKQMQEMGIPYKSGHWTPAEDQILTKNWNNFIEREGDAIENPRLLLHNLYIEDKKERKEITRLIQEKRLYWNLGQGLQRTIYSVYLRARKLFDPHHHTLKLDEDDQSVVKDLLNIYGRKWSRIGHELGFSGQALINFEYDQKIKCVNDTPFSEKEDKALKKYVRRALGKKDVRGEYRQLPWSLISKEGILLKNKRTPHQCRKRWVKFLCFHISNPDKSPKSFTTSDNIKLIRLIYESDALEENEINFDEIFTNFPDCSSPFDLSMRWYYLKVKCPRYQLKSFTNIIEWLFDVHLPTLEKKLAGISSDEESSDDGDVPQDEGQPHEGVVTLETDRVNVASDSN